MRIVKTAMKNLKSVMNVKITSIWITLKCVWKNVKKVTLKILKPKNAHAVKKVACIVTPKIPVLNVRTNIHLMTKRLSVNHAESNFAIDAQKVNVLNVKTNYLLIVRVNVS